MTAAERIKAYVDLLIVQYANKPRARATMAALVGQVVADGLLEGMGSHFDLNTADGKSLEILAEYRGLKRNVYGLDLTRAYFEMGEMSETNVELVDTDGFARYADTNVTGFFLRYRDFLRATYAMTDDELRRLIKMRAAFHGSSLGLGEIDAILFQFFGDDVSFTDGQNMTITYDGTSSSDSLFKIAKETGSFPKPAAVSMTVTP